MVTKEIRAIMQNIGHYSTSALRATASNPMIRPAIRNRARAILRQRLGVQRLHLRKHRRGR